jgi:hypothetical protein
VAGDEIAHVPEVVEPAAVGVVTLPAHEWPSFALAAAVAIVPDGTDNVFDAKGRPASCR